MEHRTLAPMAIADSARALVGEGKLSPKIDTFNYAVGTQTFGPRYQFTKEPWLVETAKRILEMGSNTIKFSMSKKQAGSEEDAFLW